MASTLDQQPPLRDKLVHVKDLLSNANRKLQDEASKYGIFATKASAASQGPAAAMLTNGTGKQNKPMQDVQELRKTINDINTMQSVLSCPVFEQIVNITDSLSQLSTHLNLRPSIGPDDMDFNANGELILKPPIEPAAFNNLINSKLDEFSESASHSPHILNPDLLNSENFINGINALKEQNQVKYLQAQSTSEPTGLNAGQSQRNGSAQQLSENEQLANNLITQRFDNKHAPQSPPPSSMSPARQGYDLEVLIKNGAESLINGNGHKSKVASIASAFEANSSLGESRPLYKTNGHFALDQMVPNSSDDAATAKHGLGQARSLNQINDQNQNAQGHFGYSNELYKTNEFSGAEPMAVDQRFSDASMKLNSSSNNNNNNYNPRDIVNNGINCVNKETLISSSTASQQQQTSLPTANSLRHNRASPSTSAGSTVRLADDLDSGTFSSKSQPNPKQNFNSPTFAKDYQAMRSDDDPTDSSIDQELIEKLSPEMKKIKVTLERDKEGLGLTIAGYICEEEEISGIFIKGIVPGSPAHRSGKIRILDQIFAVNGQEILGCCNSDAVDVLRQHTGRTVTLELMRYLAESKYRKLRTLLDDADMVPQLKNASATKQASLSNPSTSYSNVLVNRNEDSNAQQSTSNIDRPVESIYKNSSVYNNADVRTSEFDSIKTRSSEVTMSSDPLPVAAQRNATTNKIIETKQGARNTIDIKSPLCQTTATATYVNRINKLDYCDSGKQNTSSNEIKPETSDELGRLEEPEWEKDVQIIELTKEPSQSLGFTVKDYANPKDQTQSIIMITSITAGGIAERDGRLSFGDLLIFVDDQHLANASLADTVKALKRTSGQVRLGVLKLKRD